MDESWINNKAATVAPKENGACQVFVSKLLAAGSLFF